MKFLAALALVSATVWGGIENPALNPVKVLPSPSHPPVQLITEGKPRFTIVWDRAAESNAAPGLVNQPIRDAVRTLRRELFFCTGAYIPVVDLASAPVAATNHSPLIVIGRNAITRSLGINAAALPPEGFIVTSFSNGVAIVGNDSSLEPASTDPLDRHGPRRATLWGVYDFLERFLGCRYYYPGPDGCIRPRAQSLAPAPFAYTDAPRFQNRHGAPSKQEPIELTLRTPMVQADITNFLAASRVAHTSPFSSVHSPDPILFAEARPDLIPVSFLPRASGALCQSHECHHSNYYNVASLKFADALALAYKRFYDSAGRDEQGFLFNSREYAVFGQCDAFCHPSTMLMQLEVKREGLISPENLALGPNGAYSDVYARFYIHLADRLRQLLPAQKLTVLAYGGYTFAPVQERFRRFPDNVEVSLCLPKLPRFVRNPKVRELHLRELRRWRETLGGRPLQQVWLYNAGNTCFEHAVANEFLPETIALLGDNLGAVGINVETGIYPSPAPDIEVALSFFYETYCALRAQWGGERFNPEAALDELWPLCCGEAAGAHLRALHRLLKEAFLETSVKRARCGAIYPPATLNAIEKELLAARRILAGDQQSVRWRRFELMSQPLFYELDRQRLIHAGKLAPQKDEDRLRFIYGDEWPAAN